MPSTTDVFDAIVVAAGWAGLGVSHALMRGVMSGMGQDAKWQGGVACPLTIRSADTFSEAWEKVGVVPASLKRSPPAAP
jgi:hypothetical protein